MASDSSSVSAFMRIVASPSSSTLTRQSTRASPCGAISTVRVNSSSGWSVLPPSSIATCTDFFVLRKLWTMAERTTSSVWTKNRGASRRTIRSLRVMTSVWPWPTLVPWPMPQTLIRQVVRFSGMSRATSAVPLLSVVRLPTQRAVSANLVRSVGWTSGPPAPWPGWPPAAARFITRPIACGAVGMGFASAFFSSLSRAIPSAENAAPAARRRRTLRRRHR